MPQTLKYKIINSQKTSIVRDIEYDGAIGQLTIDRVLVEALPLNASGEVEPTGRSFSAELPIEALAAFPEDATLIVTIDVDPATIPPLTLEEPAPADPAPTV